MKVFKRIALLPFIAGHPAVRVLGWATVTAIDVISRTPPPLPVSQPVVRFELLEVVNKLINTFLSSKDTQTSMINWCGNACFGLVKSIFRSLTSGSRDNQIAANDIPNIMAGNIQGTALVPGLNSQVFVIALSPNMINFLGFLFLSVKGVLVFYLTYQILLFLFRYFKPFFLSNEQGDDYIDVSGRPVNQTRSHYLANFKKKGRN